MTHAEAVEQWEGALRVRGLSPRTLSTYAPQIHAALAFLKARGLEDLRRVKRGDLEDWYLGLLQRQEPLSPATLAVKVRAVKSLFSTLTAQEALLVDPSASLREPRVERLPRGVLSERELGRVLEQPDLSLPEGVRDRALLEVLYGTGMRLGELVGMELGDLDLAEGLVRVRGKGGKDRALPLGELAGHCLEAYLRDVRPELLKRSHGTEGEAKVWLNAWGSPLSPLLVQRLVKGYGLHAGLERAVTPHGFRHGAATHLLNRGANLRAVQELLGHASTSTTQRYTQVTVTELKAVHAQRHPRKLEEPEEALSVPERIRYA